MGKHHAPQMAEDTLVHQIAQIFGGSTSVLQIDSLLKAEAVMTLIKADGWKRIPPNWQGCSATDPWFGELCIIDPMMHKQRGSVWPHRSMALGSFREWPVI